MDIWTVSLELPECEGTTAKDAVKSFHAQQDGIAFVYKVTNNSTGETMFFDSSDDRTFILDAKGRPVYTDKE